MGLKPSLKVRRVFLIAVLVVGILSLGSILMRNQTGETSDPSGAPSREPAVASIGGAQALGGSDALMAQTEDLRSRVERKAKEVQDRAPQWVATGGNPGRISPLGEKLDRYLKAHNMKEADKVLNEILKILSERGSSRSTPDTVGAMTDAAIGTPRTFKLNKIPASAEIIYHSHNYIYVMDSRGGGVTQITFNNSRQLEHVAASFDHKMVAANYFADPSKGDSSSRLLVFDLEKGTETELTPNFKMAGGGGVDWDSKGYIYFSGVDRETYSAPKTRKEFIANAGLHDIYKIKYDGTGRKNLTNTPDRGEADVSVSQDGSLITYMATFIDPPNDYTEIWARDSEGNNPKLILKAGKNFEDSVHDPEISPDNKQIIYSRVNRKYKNFKRDPNANTAHDLWIINVDGSGTPQRLTDEGPINIVPDWKDSRILFLQLTDRVSPPFNGLVVVDRAGKELMRKKDANIGKWLYP